MKKGKKVKRVKSVKFVKKGKRSKPSQRSKPAIKAKVKKSNKLKKGAHLVYLGFGSNVGDREEYVEQAIFLLGKTPGIEVLKRSTNYENEAEGGVDQPSFINAAAQIRTTLSPHKLLYVTQEIENTLGREREVEWGPRTIDIDISLFDDLITSDDELQIPHPLLHERMFVLKPLKEIAPYALHPIVEKTISDIYDERKEELGTKYDDELPGFKEIKRGTYDDYERW